jgi:hypothetical protein
VVESFLSRLKRKFHLDPENPEIQSRLRTAQQQTGENRLKNIEQRCLSEWVSELESVGYRLHKSSKGLGSIAL